MYSDALIPRGLVGRLEKVLGCCRLARPVRPSSPRDDASRGCSDCAANRSVCRSEVVPGDRKFVPLRVDRHGKMIREVALARLTLPLPEYPGQDLEVLVGVIHICAEVLDEQHTEDEDGPCRWDEKTDGTHEHWLDANGKRHTF